MDPFNIFLLVGTGIVIIPYIGLACSIIGAWRDEKKYGLGKWAKRDR